MAEFKQSRLLALLDGELSQEAQDFVDACMDDFCVDEIPDIDVTMYELRGTMWGYRNGRKVEVTQVYCSDLDGTAALIEHLARCPR